MRRRTILLLLLAGCSDGRSLVIVDDLAMSTDLASSVDLAVSVDAIPGEDTGQVDAGLDLTTDDIYGNPADCPTTACVDQCGSCTTAGERCEYFENELTCIGGEWRCTFAAPGCPHLDLGSAPPPDLAPYTSCPAKPPWGAPCSGYFNCDYGMDQDLCVCTDGPLFLCSPGRIDFAVLRLDLSVQD